MENEMTSQWPQENNDDAVRATETPIGFPTRGAAAIVTLVALTFLDATPRVTIDDAQPRTEQFVPSACGADAVARAQREVNRSREPGPTALT